jgi:hypothetical protein
MDFSIEGIPAHDSLNIQKFKQRIVIEGRFEVESITSNS